MRGRWLAVTGLVLMVGGLSLLLLIKPPPASAQTLPPEVTHSETCGTNPTTQAKFITYSAKLKNVNATGTPTVSYTVVRGWSDGRADNTLTKTAAPGASVDANVIDVNANSVATQWTYTLVVKVDGVVVAGPFTSSNPCLPGSTTTTTTTTTTTSTTTTTTTTKPTTSSTTTTTPTSTTTGTSTTTTTSPASTTTDPFAGPTTTTTGNIANTANSSGGGGLAYTGVAVLAVAGAGLLLFANGAGLLRLVRRGGVDE
jgi:hypothetical protein